MDALLDMSWNDLDPNLHPFDRDRARETVGRLGPAADVPTRPADRPDHAWLHDVGAPWIRAIDEAVVEHYGPWAAGWRWSSEMGGPVRSWTFREAFTAPDETLDRVTTALLEWRGFLEELAGCLVRFPVRDTPPEHRKAMWERAAVHLVTLTIERTGATDMWYETCAAVLHWFLSASGIPENEAETLLGQAIGGRFGSWVAPSETVVADVGERLAAGLVRRDGG